MIRTTIVTSWMSLNSEVDNLLDSMIAAQNANGQISWTSINPTWAAGHVGGDEGSRVVVIDVDSADGAEIAQLTLWAAQPMLDVELPE